MRDNGRRASHAGKEPSTTLMGTCTMACGTKTNAMATESTPIQKVQDTKAIGRTIPRAGKALKYGLKEASTSASTRTERSRALELMLGRMDQCTRETGLTTELMELDNTNGRMDANITVIGTITTCTG